MSEAQAIEQGNLAANAAGKGEFLTGLGGDDVLVGANTRDALNGGAGDDRLYAGGGRDRVQGEAGGSAKTGNHAIVAVAKSCAA